MATCDVGVAERRKEAEYGAELDARGRMDACVARMRSALLVRERTA